MPLRPTFMAGAITGPLTLVGQTPAFVRAHSRPASGAWQPAPASSPTPGVSTYSLQYGSHGLSSSHSWLAPRFAAWSPPTTGARDFVVTWSPTQAPQVPPVQVVFPSEHAT